MKSIKTTVTCSNEECEEDIEVTVYPGAPAKTYGRPEDCHEEEPPEFDPEICPICECELPEIDDLGELFCNEQEARDDARFDEFKEGGMFPA